MVYEIAAVIGFAILIALAIAKLGAEFGKLLLPLGILFGIVVANGI